MGFNSGFKGLYTFPSLLLAAEMLKAKFCIQVPHHSQEHNNTVTTDVYTTPA